MAMSSFSYIFYLMGSSLLGRQRYTPFEQLGPGAGGRGPGAGGRGPGAGGRGPGAGGRGPGPGARLHKAT